MKHIEEIILIIFLGFISIPAQSISNNTCGTSLTKVGIVIDLGSAGTFDEGMAESPAIWDDQNTQRFGMVYTGYNKSASQGSIGLAWSEDLVHWSKDKRSPILSASGIQGTPDASSVTGPVIYFENKTYFLFYIGCSGNGYEQGTKSLCLATSKDLITWTRSENNPVIAPGLEEWKDTAVYHASIVKRHDIYYLFFNACGKTPEQIGYAASASLSGPWNVDSSNSPILKIGKKGTWEDGFIGDPSVYQIGNIWYMAYYGYSKTTQKAYDGLAWTTDDKFPLGWEKYSGNPVLIPGPDEFDITFAHKPFIVNYNGKHYHYYTAVGTGGRRIALALEALKSNKGQPDSK